MYAPNLIDITVVNIELADESYGGSHFPIALDTWNLIYINSRIIFPAIN